MTNPNDPKPTDFSLPSLDEMTAKAREAYEKTDLPPLDETLEQTKGFYEQYKPLILTGLGCLVLYKIEKRMVRKVVTQVLKKTPVAIDVPRYMQDYEAWYKATFDTAYNALK